MESLSWQYSAIGPLGPTTGTRFVLNGDRSYRAGSVSNFFISQCAERRRGHVAALIVTPLISVTEFRGRMSDRTLQQDRYIIDAQLVVHRAILDTDHHVGKRMQPGKPRSFITNCKSWPVLSTRP